MLRWARKVRSVGKRRDDYATQSDFCAIFFRQLDRLYSLSLILTGDELRAEECFLAGLDSCVNGSLVFRESAVAWSRRTVIKCAIRFMLPSPSNSRGPDLVANGHDSSSNQDTSLE